MFQEWVFLVGSSLKTLCDECMKPNLEYMSIRRLTRKVLRVSAVLMSLE